MQRAFRQHGTKSRSSASTPTTPTSNAAKMIGGPPDALPVGASTTARTSPGASARRGLPVTVFYDADGKQEYVHQGAYPTEAKLSEDIERYTSAS